MMSPEPRNEPQMLRWFRKTFPSYDLQPLLKRQPELEEAQWLGKRRLAQEAAAPDDVRTTLQETPKPTR